MRQSTCCFTGHRKLTPEQAVYGCLKLCEEILDAVAGGYTRFITGLAEGSDQLFAEIVLIVKKYRPEIQLVAAISHRGRLDAKSGSFQRLLKQCDQVVVLSESYNPGVYDKRNRWMLTESSRLIAVWDGRLHGGTYATVRQAKKLNIDTREIDLVCLL